MYGSGIDRCKLLSHDSDVSLCPAEISLWRALLETWRERERRNQGLPLLLGGGVSGCGHTCVLAPAFFQTNPPWCYLLQGPTSSSSPLCSSSQGRYRCPSLVLPLSPFQLFGHPCFQGPELNSLLSNSKNSFCFLDLILQAKWRK